MSSSLTCETDDITQLVDDCAVSLSLAEPFLCNHNSFSLHDAMAALQIMDSKMDCCEVPAQIYFPNASSGQSLSVLGDKTVFPRPVPTGLSDSFHKLPWNQLTTKDAAYIGSQTLIRFQAFLSGCSVGESSATCLYAHAAVLADMHNDLLPNADDTLTLEQLLLQQGQLEHDANAKKDPSYLPKVAVYAFARALLQVTEDTRNIIVNADIYEEEDVSIHSYDHIFFKQNQPDTVLSLVTTALQMVETRETKEDNDCQIVLAVLNVYLCFLTVAKFMVSVDRVDGYYILY
jgi:hypothetical protein